jgi:peptidoglycan hydrolase-like protein with peptidoglycan-binding domain/tellurite resistance protein
MAFSRKPQQSSGARLGNRLLQAVVDAGMMIALADGELEDEESEALAEAISELSDDDVSEEAIASAMQASAAELASGWEQRVQKLARTITDEDDRESVLTATAAIMLADGEVEEGDEYELFVLLAEAFDYDKDDADELLASVSKEYGDEVGEDEEDSEDEDEEDSEDEDEDEEDSEDEDEDEDEEDSEEEDEEDEEDEEAPAAKSVGRSTLKPTTLRRGDRGQEIRNLQSALNNQGYDLSVDGIFGAGTEQAVRDFQSNNGLRVDGLVGAGTRSALGMASRLASVTHASNTNAPPAKNSPVAPARRSGTSIGRGASGNHVRNIQAALSNLGYEVDIDGIFGPGTQSAVRQFQSDNGLSVDGIVGPRTWSLLAPNV